MTGDRFQQGPRVLPLAGGELLGLALLIYFVALLLAPILVPPLLAVGGTTTYADALQQVFLIDLVGYLGGLAAVLR